MILADAVVVGLLLSLVTGGSLRDLAKERLKGESVLAVVLPLQLAWPRLSDFLHWSRPLSVTVWLLLMATLVAVMTVNAPRRWALAVAAVGIACNVLVIGLNQAMPVSIRSASEVGYTREQIRDALNRDPLHVETGASDKLVILADVIPVPGPSWHRGVISIGDILLSVGLAVWVFSACRSRVAHRGRT